MIRARKVIVSWRIGAWLLLGCMVGCDAVERAQEMIPAFPTPQAEAVNSIGQGSIELALRMPSPAGDAIKTATCQAHLIRLPMRPAILQVASAVDLAHESFPSVLLRAAPGDSNLANLTAEPLAAQIFVQKIPDGPVWHSSREAPVELKIVEIGSDFVKAEFQGTLISSSTFESVPVSGKLTGRLSRVPSAQ